MFCKNLPTFLISISLVLSTLALHAQNDGQHIIALGNSSNPAGITTGEVSMFETAALSGIRQTNLCMTMERKEWEKILRERGIQKTEEFLDGKIMQQNASLGAEYLLILSMQSFNLVDKYADETRSVSATMVIGVNVVSVVTGQNKFTKNITLKKSENYSKTAGAGYNTSKNELGESFKTAMVSDCEWQFAQFIYEVFPPQITIFKIEKFDKKQRPDKVLCKSTARLPDGIKLDVYIEEKIDLGDGDFDIRKQTVGQLKIQEVQSDKVVLCDVKDGSEALLTNFNKKTPLKCSVNFSTTYFQNLNPFSDKRGFKN